MMHLKFEMASVFFS